MLTRKESAESSGFGGNFCAKRSDSKRVFAERSPQRVRNL
jgi:hypothetical protein